MTVLLEARGLTMHFGGLAAVSDVDLEVHEGEILGLIGPNGAGKTTLFNMLCGSQAPTRGTARFQGKDCIGLQPHQVAALGIARTFQITSLFPGLSVLDNVRIGTHHTTRGGFLGSFFKLPSHGAQERAVDRKAREILRFLELEGQADVAAENLPYGDQRKLEIAVALASEPILLLLDEPAAGMNPDEGRRLVAVIRALRKEGISVMLVEHHMKVVMGVCDRVIVLDHGVKIAEGTPQEVARHPDVITVYLGKVAGHA